MEFGVIKDFPEGQCDSIHFLVLSLTSVLMLQRWSSLASLAWGIPIKVAFSLLYLRGPCRPSGQGVAQIPTHVPSILPLPSPAGSCSMRRTLRVSSTFCLEGGVPYLTKPWAAWPPLF